MSTPLAYTGIVDTGQCEQFEQLAGLLKIKFRYLHENNLFKLTTASGLTTFLTRKSLLHHKRGLACVFVLAAAAASRSLEASFGSGVLVFSLWRTSVAFALVLAVAQSRRFFA